MHIFIDSADIAAIAWWKETGIIDGVTTNPTNLSTIEGNPAEVIRAICTLLPTSDISVEVTERDPERMYQQAKSLTAIAPNIVVKIPCHRDYYAVIQKLVSEGVAINITLVFTLIQGLLMCKLGVRYISPFVGRWDDLDVDGRELLYELRSTIDQYTFSTKILAASLRQVQHVHEALCAGVDALTVSVKLLERITMHPLTESGMTKFHADWQKKNIARFP